MEVKIKCGEVYKFHKINWVKFYSNEFIEVKGNFKARGKYKEKKIRIETVSNMKEVNRYLKKFTKHRKDYEGLCPKCNAENIIEIGFSKHVLHLNNNFKKRPKYEKYKLLRYKCLQCKEVFNELKKCDIEIYYM